MQRLAPLDWMRGLVMVLMAIDHSSMAFNPGRIADDSALMYDGSALPLAQFFTRWITHLCAPTFVLLAGAALALSAESRLARGESEREIDRNLLIRGTLLVALDVFWITTLSGQTLVLQVLYALGIGMIAMVPLRRLRPGLLLTLGIGWFVVGEVITLAVWDVHNPTPHWLVAGLVGLYHGSGRVLVYPALPWLAIMMIGWAFGVFLRKPGDPPVRGLVVVGVGLLVVFGVVRGMNDYGNMQLFRLDGSLVQWLHVSKYPPSLAFASLELGLIALFLAGFFATANHVSVRPRGPLLVFGQTALFFYLIHFVILFGMATLIHGQIGAGSLTSAYFGAAAALLILYPICLGYRGLKQRYPGSLLRYI